METTQKNKITGYKCILLSDLIDELGKDRAKRILSEFSCPLNKDVEDFIRYKAIIFAEQRIASTYLIFTSYKNEVVLIGYYSIANKVLSVKKSALSSNYRKRISKFARFSDISNSYVLTAPLIAQLSKNFSNGYNNLISGEELLQMACESVNYFQLLSSGKVVYLECEDHPALLEFYRRNGFYDFGKRTLDKDEAIDGEYLIQMLKYL